VSEKILPQKRVEHHAHAHFLLPTKPFRHFLASLSLFITMVRYNVRPNVRVADGGKNVNVGAHLSFNHNDNELSVSFRFDLQSMPSHSRSHIAGSTPPELAQLQVDVSESCFRNGVSADGLSLGLKNDRLEVHYDVVSLRQRSETKTRSFIPD
jgi:hypothetical protein